MKIGKPPSSRNQLRWSKFKKTESGDWFLSLMPHYYAQLIELDAPDIINKSRIGFYDSKSGKTKNIFLRNLTSADVDCIEQLLCDYEQLVIINLNKHIEDLFTNELDYCVALDFLRSNPESDHRTEVGELVYQSKSMGDRDAATSLAYKLGVLLKRMHKLSSARQHRLSFVPPNPLKEFDLPRHLCELLVKNEEVSSLLDPQQPLIESVLKRPKAPIKNLSVEEKAVNWNKLIEDEQIEINGDPTGCSVIVVDDLYQSGTTLWSYAKYLKARGAIEVIGLVCVKNLRDKDNK